MTQEELQLLLELGSYDDRASGLNQDLQTAIASRNRPAPPQARTPFGAVAFGLNDAMHTIGSHLQETGIRNEQKKLLERKRKGLEVGNELASVPAPNVSGLFDPNATPQALQTQETQAGAQLADYERRARMLMATGRPELMQQGQAMMQQVHATRKSLLEAPMQREERKLSRDKYQRDLDKDAANLKLSEAELAERARHNKAMEEIGRRNAAVGRSAVQEERHEKQVEADVQKLGKDLEDTAVLNADAETLLAAASQEDIPGVGPVEGFLPNLLTSEEGVKTRQAAGRLMAAILKKQSGQAVSESEVERNLKARGLGDRATQVEYRTGLRALVKELGDTFKRTEAKYRPEVTARFRERGGTTSAETAPLLERAEALGGGPSRIKSDEEFDALPSGAVFVGPDGKKRKKP